MWRQADFNVAVATGGRSKVFVVDTDSEEAEAALRALGVPPTVTAITPRGKHRYYRHPIGIDIRNSASKVAAHVDVRAAGGYVLAPPSIHPSGVPYRWDTTVRTFASPPSWLVERAITPTCKSGATPTRPSADWRSVVLGGVDEGARNATLCRLSGHLLRRVDPIVALALLQSWNATHCRPPLSAAEVEQVVNSVAGLVLSRLRNSE
jgi:hypothetical protein